jgi:hypothetical protein
MLIGILPSFSSGKHFYPHFVKTTHLFAPTLNNVGSIQIKRNKINTKTLPSRTKRSKYPLSLILIPSVTSTVCLTRPDRRTLPADREDDRSRSDRRSETVGAQTGRVAHGPAMWAGLRARARARCPANGAWIRRAARERPVRVGVRPREVRAPPGAAVVGGASSARGAAMDDGENWRGRCRGEGS